MKTGICRQCGRTFSVRKGGHPIAHFELEVRPGMAHRGMCRGSFTKVAGVQSTIGPATRSES